MDNGARGAVGDVVVPHTDIGCIWHSAQPSCSIQRVHPVTAADMLRHLFGCSCLVLVLHSQLAPVASMPSCKHPD